MRSNSTIERQASSLLYALISRQIDEVTRIINNFPLINHPIDSSGNTAFRLAYTTHYDILIAKFIINHNDFDPESNQFREVFELTVKNYIQNKAYFMELLLLLLTHNYFHSAYMFNPDSDLGRYIQNNTDEPIVYLMDLLSSHYKYSNSIHALTYRYKISKQFKKLGAPHAGLEWEYSAISAAMNLIQNRQLEWSYSNDEFNETTIAILKNTVKYYMAGQTKNMPYIITQSDAFNAAMLVGCWYFKSSKDSTDVDYFHDAINIAKIDDISDSNSVLSNSKYQRKIEFLKIFTTFHAFGTKLSSHQTIEMMIALEPLLQIPTQEAQLFFHWVEENNKKWESVCISAIHIFIVNLCAQTNKYKNMDIKLEKNSAEIYALTLLYGLGKNVDLENAVLQFEKIAKEYKDSDPNRSYDSYIMSLHAQHEVLKKIPKQSEDESIKNIRDNLVAQAAATCEAMMSFSYYTTETRESTIAFIKASTEPYHTIILLKSILHHYRTKSLSTKDEKDIRNLLNDIINSLKKANLLYDHMHIIARTMIDCFEENKRSGVRTIILDQLFELFKNIPVGQLTAEVEYLLRESLVDVCSMRRLTYGDQCIPHRANVERMEQIAIANPNRNFNIGEVYFKSARSYRVDLDLFIAYQKAIEYGYAKAALEICHLNPYLFINNNKIFEVLYSALAQSLFPANIEIISTIAKWLEENKKSFMTKKVDIDKFRKLESLSINANQYLNGNLETLIRVNNFLPALVKLVQSQQEDLVTPKTLFLSIKLLAEITLNKSFHQTKYSLKDSDIADICSKQVTFLTKIAYSKEDSQYKSLAHEYMELYLKIQREIIQLKSTSEAIPEYNVDTYILLSASDTSFDAVVTGMKDGLGVDDAYIEELQLSYQSFGVNREMTLAKQDLIISSNSITNEIINSRSKSVRNSAVNTVAQSSVIAFFRRKPKKENDEEGQEMQVFSKNNVEHTDNVSIAVIHSDDSDFESDDEKNENSSSESEDKNNENYTSDSEDENNEIASSDSEDEESDNDVSSSSKPSGYKRRHY